MDGGVQFLRAADASADDIADVLADDGEGEDPDNPLSGFDEPYDPFLEFKTRLLRGVED